MKNSPQVIINTRQRLPRLVGGLVSLILAGCTTFNSPASLPLTRVITPQPPATLLLPSIEAMTPPPLPPLAPMSSQPLPSNLLPITVENATSIRELAILSRGPIQEFSFSADNHFLAVTSSTGVWIHNLRELGESPRLLTSAETKATTGQFSPTRALFATGYLDGSVLLWDTTGWTNIHALKQDEEVTSLRFSPDGQWLASGSASGTVMLFNLKTKQIALTLPTHISRGSLIFSNDSNLLAYGGIPLGANRFDESLIYVWNTLTGEILKGSNSEPNRFFLYDLAFSPDNSRLIINGTDTHESFSRSEQTLLLALTSSKPDWESLYQPVEYGQPGGTIRMAVSPAGPIAFSGLIGKIFTPEANPKIVTVWRHGQSYRLEEYVHPNGMVFSPDGATLAIVHAEQGTQGILISTAIWDVETGRRLATIGCGDPVFSPDSSMIATVCNHQSVQVWETRTGRGLGRWLGYESVRGVVFNATDSILTSSGPRRWDVQQGLQLDPPEWAKRYVAAEIAVSLDGEHFAGVTGRPYSDSILLWSEVSETPPQILNTNYATDIRWLAFSLDNKTLASAGNGNISLWDVETATQKSSLLSEERSAQHYIGDIAFSPDGNYFAADRWDDGNESTVFVWETQAGREISRVTVKGRAGLKLAFNANGRYLAFSTSDESEAEPSVWVWDWQAAAPTALKGHSRRISILGFSPIGALLATGSDDGTLCLWDAATGQSIRVLAGHASPVADMVFTADGALLASQAADGSVRLWDVASGNMFAVLESSVREAELTYGTAYYPAPGNSHSLTLSHDEKLLAITRSDGSLRLWGVAAQP